MQIDGFDGRANGFLFFFQESESLPMHYDLSLFVICVECCRRVQISWVYFAARLQSWILSFCFEGSELAIIGRLFSIRLLLVYPRTRPSKTSSCRWECTSSSTRQKVFAIWDKQNAIQHLLDYFCVISCTERVVCTSLAETQEYSKGLKKIGKDWKGFLAFDLTAAPGKIV